MQPSVGFSFILAEKTFICGFTLTCYYWALLPFGIAIWKGVDDSVADTDSKMSLTHSQPPWCCVANGCKQVQNVPQVFVLWEEPPLSNFEDLTQQDERESEAPVLALNMANPGKISAWG